MASYFPFYFYKAFDLKGLRFHAVYGVPLFLLLPYILCFWIFYAWTGDLETAVRYGMVVPFIYSLYLLWAMRKAIQLKSIDLNRNGIYESSLEMNAVYLAVAPWVCMSVFSYFQVSQWLEVLATNLGLIVITILFMLRSVRFERLERERLLALVARNKQDIQDFETSCLAFGLSRREQEIAAPLCAGMTYKQIAASLYISEKTVDAHVRRIFFKTKVNKKIELRQRLGVAI
ncbi:helix-turn-helix domain-containing protein [Pedobacter sp. GR22-6]|uniref:helix-turn-helix domain-containing protein n=1 Tax=Pedobacter sp. GR22-6 TaxID=3127957 RepID=UPI00307F9C87